MPKGPQGQKRPADVIGNAITVAKIATGEMADGPVVASDGKSAGGYARASKLTAERRKEIGRKAASERWRKEGSMTQVERMKHAMFPSDGESVVNVKFFLGSGRVVTGEQLADQLDRADAQLRSKATARTTKLDGDLTVTAI